MWAPIFPVSFGFNSSVTQRRCATVVSVQPPRFSSHSHSHSQASSEEVKGLGQAVLNSLDFPNSETLDREESIRRELSGSEVLLALQKARAQRIQRPKKKTGPIRSRGGAKETVDCRNVRPLVVKSDWGVRLDELEKRLQDFVNE